MGSINEVGVARAVMSVVGSPVRVGVRARRRRVSTALCICTRVGAASNSSRRSRDELGVTRTVMGIVGSPVRVGVRAGRRRISAAVGVRA